MSGAAAGAGTRPTALRDAHLHLYAHGEALSFLDVSACASAAECLERVSALAARTPRGEWVRAVGARVEAWRERAWPMAGQIDDAAGGRPCVIRSFDHHALVAGAAALRAAGISRETPDPPRGMIERAPAPGRGEPAGQPTGLLLEDACGLVLGAIPEASPERRREHLQSAARDLAARGFVEAHDMLTEPWLGEELAAMDDRGELPLDVWLYAPFERLEAEQSRAKRYTRDRVRFAGAKFFADGTLNSRTAFMLADYAQPREGMPRGKAIWAENDLAAAVRTCEARGAGGAIHAIGDAAVRMALNAIEQAGARTQLWRIEHCQFIDEAEVDRFTTLNVVASVQPCHLLTDIEALRRLTPNRARRAFPLRDLVDSATALGREPADMVWLGSDTPVVSPDPEDNVQAAAHRRRRDMPAEEAVALEQGLRIEDVWRLMAPTKRTVTQ